MAPPLANIPRRPIKLRWVMRGEAPRGAYREALIFALDQSAAIQHAQDVNIGFDVNLVFLPSKETILVAEQ
ncbi:MAG: hypothetical protein OXE05_13350 [Chloroflexi bacterium]|nr:hypothetical protein [Chloroflexota bacterium]